MANFWQARPSQWQPHQRRVATAANAFYSAKSRQGLGLGGHASRGRPVNVVFSAWLRKQYHVSQILVILNNEINI